MIEKLKFFLSVTGNNLWQFRTRNLFSVTIICLSFLTVGIFMSLSNNLRATARELSSNMSIAFYLDEGLVRRRASTPIRQEIRAPAVRRERQVVEPGRGPGAVPHELPGAGRHRGRPQEQPLPRRRSSCG